MTGKVYLIGAGPGDPGLITLRGAQLLACSDVVLYDGLSNAALLAHAPTAQHISVGKHGRSRIWQQSEIIEEMLSHARLGRTVARLKGGDPAVFARTAEEVDALHEAGIPFEIVPGITAALAAGSYAGIPITHRKLASAVALVTGHEEPGKQQSALDWDALARFPGTLVVYMGVTTAETWTRLLIQAGKDPATPTALVRRCSLPDQQSIHCRLDEVAGHLTPASRFRPPVVAIIGPVTQLADAMDWTRRRPLSGRTVLVTRPADQAEALAGPLRELGAHVLVQPAITISPPADWTAVDTAIESLSQNKLLIFCSVNGVRFFLDRLLNQHGDTRLLAGNQIAVVGEKTADALAEYSLKPDIVPSDFRSKSLADQIQPHVNGQRVTIVRASRGSDELAESLIAGGADVRQVVAYSHRDVDELDPEILSIARDGQIDWITVTSSATARNLHRLLGPAIKHSKIASLSPVTSATLTQLGIEVSAEANPFTIESLIGCIVDHEHAIT
ncbi:uroporphyrinogen-III C-methyltransferase [Stieleria varia]|uniref:uroporphyrinogen-III C-methyltransferase n=1 Tax=Stieleria varia TaxID=2528005 RepID=A0A5C6A2M4_9BACT|nr:uroporphyrinogen-III C-methyltransferase [Stieleria varia]TWT92703.1 Uroporphyrinogen-III C-methyltransferase [Stieleria varia]